MLIANLFKHNLLTNKLVLLKQFSQRANLHVLTRNIFYPGAKPQQQSRTFISFIRPKTQRDFKIADNIPDEHTLIYRNGMSKYITGAQIVIVATTSIILIALAVNSDVENYEMRYGSWSKATKVMGNETMVFLTSFFMLVVMVQILISRSPLRIYKMAGSDKYTIISPGSYPFSTQKIVFKRGQMAQMESTGVLPWRDSRYLISFENESQRVILFDDFFRRPADLNIMLGQQRDPDEAT